MKYLPFYEGRFLTEPGQPGNTGGSWVATFTAVPNLDGTFAILYFSLLSFSASDFLFVCFVLTMLNLIHNEKFQDTRRTTNKYRNGFLLYVEGLRTIMHINPSIYCGKPFQCLFAVLLVSWNFSLWIKFNMSWKKQSAEAGLAGLSPREAALGTLWDETMIMKMPDPLGHIPDLLRVKKEDLFMVVRFYCIQS